MNHTSEDEQNHNIPSSTNVGKASTGRNVATATAIFFERSAVLALEEAAVAFIGGLLEDTNRRTEDPTAAAPVATAVADTTSSPPSTIQDVQMGAASEKGEDGEMPEEEEKEIHDHKEEVGATSNENSSSDGKPEEEEEGEVGASSNKNNSSDEKYQDDHAKDDGKSKQHNITVYRVDSKRSARHIQTQIQVHPPPTVMKITACTRAKTNKTTTPQVPPIWVSNNVNR